MDWDSLYWQAAEALLPIVLALFGAALTLGVVWLKRQTAQIGNTAVRETADKLMWDLKTELYTAVDAVSQQWVSDIKDAKKDGKLTKAERDKAKRDAIALFLDRLNETQKKLAKELLGDISKWAGTELEAYLSRRKAAIAGNSPRPS